MNCKKVTLKLPQFENLRVLLGLVVENENFIEITTAHKKYQYHKNCVISIEPTDQEFRGEA